MHALPEDAAILPPQLRASAGEIPFLEVTALLARHGVPVPEIYAVERAERWVLLEDFGDTHLLDLDPRARAQRFAEAVELLARVHALPREDALPFRRASTPSGRASSCARSPSTAPPRPFVAALDPELDALARAVAALPHVLALRDYQSQNLMVDSRGRLRLLDYQDALLAPAELDLAALLHDSYVEIASRRAQPRSPRATGRRAAAPRIPAGSRSWSSSESARTSGATGMLVERKGDLRYRPYIARARASVLGALPALPPALRRLAELLPAALAERGA